MLYKARNAATIDNSVTPLCFSSPDVVPLIPTGFQVTSQFDLEVTTTIRFEWDPPPGRGPETVVDNYLISIAPRPLSHPINNRVNSAPWNVTIDYNIQYEATITAVNCAGESDSFVLSGLEFSECDR